MCQQDSICHDDCGNSGGIRRCEKATASSFKNSTSELFSTSKPLPSSISGTLSYSEQSFVVTMLAIFGGLSLGIMAIYGLSRKPFFQFRQTSTDGTIFNTTIKYAALRLGKCIAHGAEGRVYKAHYQGQLVAVKEIVITEAMQVQKIKQEALILQHLVHPAVIHYYGTAYREGGASILLVMEFALGSLEKFLYKQSRPLKSLESKFHAITQIAEGLSFLHSRSVIHRDLKPSNLLVTRHTRDGMLTIKLADFGMACMHDNVQKSSNVGTPSYLAPEVLSQTETCEYNELADVYAFGILLNEIFAAEKPYWDTHQEATFNLMGLMLKIQHGFRPKLATKAPPLVQALISNCWAAKPADRPNMDRVAKLLGNYSRSLPGDRPSETSSQLSCPDYDTATSRSHSQSLDTVGQNSSFEEFPRHSNHITGYENPLVAPKSENDII